MKWLVLALIALVVVVSIVVGLVLTKGSPTGTQATTEKRTQQAGSSPEAALGKTEEEAWSVVVTPSGSPPERPARWSLRSDVTLPISRAPSFGASVSDHGSLLLVGAPLEHSYGELYAYDKSTRDQSLKLVQQLSFSAVGSPYQKAGVSIQEDLVCAPEFGSQGAIFVLSDLQDTPRIKRLVPDRGDGFSIQKTGQGIARRGQWVFVAKERGSQCHVDVFRNQHDTWTWQQTLESPGALRETQKLFGYAMTIQTDWAAVNNPVLNECYVFAQDDADGTWTYRQTLEAGSAEGDEIDLHQELRASASHLAVCARDRVTMFRWDRSQMVQTGTIVRGQVWDVAWHPRESVFALATEQGTIEFVSVDGAIFDSFSLPGRWRQVKLVWNEGRSAHHLFVYGRDSADHHLAWWVASKDLVNSSA